MQKYNILLGDTPRNSFHMIDDLLLWLLSPRNTIGGGFPRGVITDLTTPREHLLITHSFFNENISLLLCYQSDATPEK